jgi:excinuclease Cho
MANSELPHTIDAQSLAALPRSAGVYIFRGTGALPLYIGKSVDIRARVLSHLRTSDEARMIAQTRRIDFVQTAGEIGALLLEAQMIKTQHPLFNIRLRRLRSLCSIRLKPDAQGVVPDFVHSTDIELAHTQGLYGLFSSRHAAWAQLRELAAQHALCLGLLGAEKISARGCFGVQIKTCRGACIGAEARAEHDARLLSALTDLQVHAWPYPGAIEVVERDGDWVQKHRVQDWRYLGTWCSKGGSFSAPEATGFDLDTYKILVKPVMLQTVEMEWP